MTNMDITPTENLVFKWKNTRFVSSTTKTDQFKSFVKDFKKAIKKELPSYLGAEFTVGHFYISGFFHNLDKDTYAYFSVSDVRFFQDSWIDDVLIRTAKNNKDYTGGSNRYCHITNLVEKAIDVTGGRL